MTELGKSKAICILGMHRSGTSALARAINLLGVYLGEEKDICNASFDNPEGFWEQLEIRDFHDSLLSEFGKSWDTVTPLKYRWDESAEAQPFKDQLRLLIGRLFRGRVLWGWKEPRTCFFPPLWKSVLDELNTDLDCLFVVRNPHDVACSLGRRNGFSISKSYGIWFNYTLSALRAITDVPAVFVHYDRFIENWEQELKRCAQALGIPWPNDDAKLREAMASFLRPDLRHSFSNASDLESVPELVRELYAILLKIADGEALAVFSEILDEMHRDFTRYQGLFEPRMREEQAFTIDHRVTSLQLQVNELIAQSKMLKEELSEKDEHLADRDKELMEKEKRLTEAEARIRTLLESYSWRVTSPLRKIYEVLFSWAR